MDWFGLADLEFPSIIVNKAHVERLSGDLVSARELLREALSREPENAGAYFQLGAIEQAEGHTTAAMADYLASLDRDPFFYASYGRARAILENIGISPSYIDSYVSSVLAEKDHAALRGRLIGFVADRTGADLED